MTSAQRAIDELPFVTVLIPALNCEQEVAGCLRALRHQDYPAERFEIVVVDNGSRDRTVGALQAEGVEPFHRSDRGRSRALNRGLEAARGEIVCSTDMTCRPEPQWISEVVRSFADPAVGCVAGEIRLLEDHDNAAIRYQRRRGYMSPIAAQRRTRPPFMPYADGANASFRRAVFDEIGRFEESFFKAADVEICYRLFSMTNYKMAYNAKAAVREPGEPSVAALVKQRFRIGMGHVLLRRRFPALYVRPTGAHGPRRAYWRLRAKGRSAVWFLATLARAVASPSARSNVADAVIELSMSHAQWLGLLYGRWLLARDTSARPSPIQSEFLRRYRGGEVDLASRLVA